jgi:hypothetical protein
MELLQTCACQQYSHMDRQNHAACKESTKHWLGKKMSKTTSSITAQAAE